MNQDDLIQADIDFVEKFPFFEEDAKEYTKLWLTVHRLETGNSGEGIAAVAAWNKYRKRYHDDQGSRL